MADTLISPTIGRVYYDSEGHRVNVAVAVTSDAPSFSSEAVVQKRVDEAVQAAKAEAQTAFGKLIRDFQTTLKPHGLIFVSYLSADDGLWHWRVKAPEPVEPVVPSRHEPLHRALALGKTWKP